MKKLPATTHTVTMKPANEYPSATVYVRTVALCKNATSTSPLTATYPCARGRSAGYFQARARPAAAGRAAWRHLCRPAGACRHVHQAASRRPAHGQGLRPWPAAAQIQRIKSRTASVEGAAAAVMVGGVMVVVGAVFLDKCASQLPALSGAACQASPAVQWLLPPPSVSHTAAC